MSSACVCHTDEWCFYHEMYIPLEDRFNMAIVERDGSRRAAEQYRKENEFLKNELDKAQRGLEFALNSHRYVEMELETAHKVINEIATEKHDLINEVDSLKNAIHDLCTEHTTMKSALQRIVTGQYEPFENYLTVSSESIASLTKESSHE